MSMQGLLTKPVTIVYLAPGGKDQYGQPVSRETRVPSKCYYRMQRTMVGDDVYMVEEQIKLYLPADVNQAGISAVELDSVKYEPAGVPFPQYNPRTKRTEYVMLSVRKAKS
jgi:hypothetical protein